MVKLSSGSLSDEEKNLRLIGPMSKYASWQFDSISRHIRGDVLEIGGGTGTMSRMLLSQDKPPASLTITETNPKNLLELRNLLGGDCMMAGNASSATKISKSRRARGFFGKVRHRDFGQCHGACP